MSLRPIDFLTPVPKTPRWGILWLGVGILAMLGAAVLQHRWALERQSIQQEVERRQDIAQRKRLAKPIASVPSLDERRLQRATFERARPWLPMLSAIEAATRDPVYLLSLNVDAASGRLRLEAEAPSFEHALAYVQVLPDGVGLASAGLVTHELLNDPATGRSGIRFTATAQWAAP